MVICTLRYLNLKTLCILIKGLAKLNSARRDSADGQRNVVNAGAFGSVAPIKTGSSVKKGVSKAHEMFFKKSTEEGLLAVLIVWPKNTYRSGQSSDRTISSEL